MRLYVKRLQSFVAVGKFLDSLPHVTPMAQEVNQKLRLHTGVYPTLPYNDVVRFNCLLERACR